MTASKVRNMLATCCKVAVLLKVTRIWPQLAFCIAEPKLRVLAGSPDWVSPDPLVLTFDD